MHGVIVRHVDEKMDKLVRALILSRTPDLILGTVCDDCKVPTVYIGRDVYDITKIVIATDNDNIEKVVRGYLIGLPAHLLSLAQNGNKQTMCRELGNKRLCDAVYKVVKRVAKQLDGASADKTVEKMAELANSLLPITVELTVAAVSEFALCIRFSGLTFMCYLNSCAATAVTADFGLLEYLLSCIKGKYKIYRKGEYDDLLLAKSVYYTCINEPNMCDAVQRKVMRLEDAIMIINAYKDCVELDNMVICKG